MEAELRAALNATPTPGWPAAGIVRDAADGTLRVLLLSLRPLAHAPRTQRQAGECWRWLQALAAGRNRAPDGRTIPPLPVSAVDEPVGLWLVGFDRADPLPAVATTKKGKKWAPHTRYSPISELAAPGTALETATAEVRWFLPREELAAHDVLGEPVRQLREAMGRDTPNQDGWSWVDRHGNMQAVLRGLQTLQEDFLELRLSGAGLDRWPALEPEGLDDWARLDRVAARWLLRPGDVPPLVTELGAAPKT